LALRRIGEEAIRKGRVGLVVLNGGMATRFGGCVKGTVAVDGDRSFLGLKLLDASRTAAAVGGPLPPVMLMNSQATTEATEAHLRENDFFGYDPDQVWLFEQCWSVRFEPSGEVFRGADGQPSFHGPGHGDLTSCLRHSGLLARFVAGGGQTLLMTNVDNAAASLDPVILGWHIQRGQALTAEMADMWPGDVGGVPLWVDGHLQIVEAFRAPPEIDVTDVGVLNINTLWMETSCIDDDFDLDWFTVVKQVDGRSAVQFERLVGQVSAFVPSAFLRVERAGSSARFIPVKTPEDLERGRAEVVRAWSREDNGS
jgi:UTP--glucose-1-phosphate uridylyltransferase